ncbi:MAG TPA: response regulator [Vicinamibacteria bacterium]|jgi:signal transduction histidine kinase/FixJ family two-component response regulator
MTLRSGASIEKDVLVVDDEPMVRDFVAKVLTRNGFACRTASDAGEAVASAMDRAPSLVVTDVRMPGKDGGWLLSELRKRWPLIPVIMLTAVSDAKQAVECLKAGAQDYLLKPVDIQELLRSVRRGLEGASDPANGARNTAQSRSARIQEALSTIQAALQDSANPEPSSTPPGATRRNRAAEELDIFHKLASASRHSLDLQHVAAFLMRSLHRIVDYDAAALLLLEDEPSLTIQSRAAKDEEFTQRVRAHIANTLKLTCGLELPSSIAVRSIEADPNSAKPAAPHKLRSVVNVPLSVGGSVVGLIHVSSGRDQAFVEDEVQFVHRAADFLSSSVQGVRELLATVKGRIEQMVDHMTDGVLMLDAKGRVAAMNGAARTLLGCEETASPDPAMLSELLQGDLVERMRSERRSVKKLVCLRGAAYQMQASPVEDSGELAGIVLAFRDFEDEKRADEMKSELVNVVSHELRTPLTAIRNALSLLGGPKLGSLSPGQNRFVDLAKRNVEQLIAIINDLLDLSKIEAGKLQLELTPTSIAAEIEEALSSLQPQAEAKGVSLKCTIAPDLPPVQGHAASIQRVMVNLVGNALKFTDPGGLVEVEARRDDGDEVAGAAGAIRIAVTDSGVGIPKDQLESIFEKFNQVDAPETRTAPGTGLGLTISRELVKAHHGRIWAESEAGRGARFSFVLPILSQQELLMRALSSEVARASELEAPMTLVVGRLRGAYGIRARSDEEYQRAMDEVLAKARNLVRRSSDLVLARRDKGEVVVILPRTPRDGGVAFANRLADEMAKDAPGGESIAMVKVAAAQYPEDGSSAEELYRITLERIGEIVIA